MSCYNVESINIASCIPCSLTCYEDEINNTQWRFVDDRRMRKSDRDDKGNNCIINKITEESDLSACSLTVFSSLVTSSLGILCCKSLKRCSPLGKKY